MDALGEETKLDRLKKAELECVNCGWVGRFYQLEKVTKYVGSARYFCPDCGKKVYPEDN